MPRVWSIYWSKLKNYQMDPELKVIQFFLWMVICIKPRWNWIVNTMIKWSNELLTFNYNKLIYKIILWGIHSLLQTFDPKFAFLYQCKNLTSRKCSRFLNVLVQKCLTWSLQSAWQKCVLEKWSTWSSKFCFALAKRFLMTKSKYALTSMEIQRSYEPVNNNEFQSTK